MVRRLMMGDVPQALELVDYGLPPKRKKFATGVCVMHLIPIGSFIFLAVYSNNQPSTHALDGLIFGFAMLGILLIALPLLGQVSAIRDKLKAKSRLILYSGILILVYGLIGASFGEVLAFLVISPWLLAEVAILVWTATTQSNPLPHLN